MKNKFMSALRGLLTALGNRDIVIQLILGALTILAGFVIGLTGMEWMLVILCIAAVIAAEIFNTCVEKLSDLYSLKPDERIRVIKDMAAGGVLVVCIGALAIALLIMGNHVGGN